MSSREPIRVFEYEKLRLKENGKFQKSHFDALVKFNEQHENKYFSIIHEGIQFKQYVGVIQIGGLTIEILPKADKNSKHTDSDKDLWQSVLLHMLRVCKHIQVDNVSEAQLRKRNNSILDVYFEMFLNEVEALIKKGFFKNYRKIQSNQLSLKGKLVFDKNIQKNLVHKERFYCEHQVYDQNHLIHKILKFALSISKTLIPPYLQDKWNRLYVEMDHIDLVTIQSSHFQKIKLNRKSKDYEKAIDIAKMLILNYSPNINSGRDNMLTLLFDMNELWEEYVYRILRRNSSNNVKVQGQSSELFWNNKRIRPDIVIEMNGEKYVIDTKWKLVESHKPSDDDLKQMFVYNLYYRAEKSLLLYPKVYQTEQDFGVYHFKPIHQNSDDYEKFENQCKVGFLNLIKDGKMREEKDLSNEIFKKLNILEVETM